MPKILDSQSIQYRSWKNDYTIYHQDKPNASPIRCMRVIRQRKYILKRIYFVSILLALSLSSDNS